MYLLTNPMKIRLIISHGWMLKTLTWSGMIFEWQSGIYYVLAIATCAMHISNLSILYIMDNGIWNSFSDKFY